MLLFAGVEVGVRGHALPSGTRHQGDGGFGKQKRHENEERKVMKEHMMIKCPSTIPITVSCLHCRLEFN